MKTVVDLRHFLMARALHYKKVWSEFIENFSSCRDYRRNDLSSKVIIQIILHLKAEAVMRNMWLDLGGFFFSLNNNFFGYISGCSLNINH